MSTATHPPTLLTRVERCLKQECGVTTGAALVVGVSGGPDSVALLDALSRLRSGLRLDLCAVSVDHGLRAQARKEVQLVQRIAEERGVPVEVRRLQLQEGPNLQARARAARYQCFSEVADALFGEAALVVTAHHKQDRAETVLLRLLRGTSLEGLSALPARDGRRLRPMIRADRRAVMAHLQRHGIPFAQDPSNRQSRFLRVRVRQELLPLMAELNPGAIDHLVQLADEAAELPDALGLNAEQRQQLRRALKDPTIALDLPLSRGLRVVREKPTSGVHSAGWKSEESGSAGSRETAGAKSAGSGTAKNGSSSLEGGGESSTRR